MNISPADGSYSSFCNIITGYRLAAVILQSVRTGVMTSVGPKGSTEAVLVEKTWMKPEEGGRFIALLIRVGLLEKYDERIYLSQFSRKYLSGESDSSQLHVLEFEQGLMERWTGLGEVLRTGQGGAGFVPPDGDYEERLDLFQKAMKEAALVRSRELWDALYDLPEKGTIIDIGAGDGLYLQEFLRRFPLWKAIAVDLAEVVARIDDQRISVHGCNLLDSRELAEIVAPLGGRADLLLLSNLIHCYSEEENSLLLMQLKELVARDGRVVVHDFFTDANGFGALYDLHMMVNTFSGRAYSFNEAERLLAAAGFPHWELLALPSFSHGIVATREKKAGTVGDGLLRLRQKALSLGFFAVETIDPALVTSEPWVRAKCRYGCKFHGRKWSCPPHSPGEEEFRSILGCYSEALLVVGQPPLQGFQGGLLELEKTAFLDGYKKALVFSGGPCSWCNDCPDDKCRFPEKRRPSLEACGCDLFSLTELCHIRLEPLKSRDDFVQYVGLLLVE